MKKLIGLLGIALLVSCSGDPIPNDLQFGNSNVNHYSFDWETNDNQSASFTIYRQGVAFTTDNITDKHFEVDIPTNTIFRFNVRDYSVRPQWKLTISKRKQMNLQSGVYEPDNYTILDVESGYNQGINFGATTKKDGTLKID
jgi:hypothetical protein